MSKLFFYPAQLHAQISAGEHTDLFAMALIVKNLFDEK